MMLSLRRMVQVSAWSAVLKVLALARIEARDTASAPPLIMVKREQVLDILSLLEPFEEALQVKENRHPHTLGTYLWALIKDIVH